MNDHPAVRRAKVLAHYGRGADAERELRKALETDPKNTELLIALLEVRPKPSPPGEIRHQVIGWLLLVGSVTLTMAPLVLSIKPIERRLEGLPGDTLVLLLAFGGFLAAIIASLVAGLYLFFWLWFSYLRRLPDPDLLLLALGDVARAKGMAQVAKDSGLGRESLYKALAPGAKPRFETVMKVARALGVKFTAQPA